MKLKNIFKVLSLIIMAFFSACSNDDSTTIQEPDEPVIQRYVSTYKHIQGGNPDYTYEHTFVYNADKSIKEIIWEYYLDESINEVYTYKFSYDTNKRINKIEQYTNGELLDNETSIIAYDENGYINQIGSYPVNYNSTTNTYTLQTDYSIFDYRFNEEQDIVIFDNLNMVYDAQNKGAGYDSQNQILILLMRSNIGSELVLPLSKRPLISYSNEFVERVYANEYDEEGYLVKATETTYNDIYEFTYINL